MNRTVDLVIAGAGASAVTTAARAVRRGLRVLVLLSSNDRCAAHQLRRTLREDAGVRGGHVTVVAHAEVVCVDGVGGVEVVVVRDTRTGRLSGVNTSKFLQDAAREA